ncbi:DUF881 domain-containing protein [Streptomyces sp. NPDC046977]|uniref:DUF881 domain-containing protein n=1 Tax=Streptomyces sp. NPDC046977 TaxID=3154703 RepID=UPI0033D17116
MSNPVHASPTRRSARSVVLRLLSAAVFALAGLLFWVSFDTAKGVDIRTDEPLLRLSDRVQEKSRQNEKLDNELSGVRKDVDSLAHADSGVSDATRDRLDRLSAEAGTSKLSGPAVSVTLNDAPPDAAPLIAGVPDPQPNDLVIHQQDLQAVVNALWAGGAAGIKVMDQRLISTSAVRCVGNTLILQGRVYSPPYKITAVGDPGKLHKAIDRSPAIQNYLQYVEAYGLGWKVEDDKRVTLPGYSGTVDLHYAKPVG